MYSQLNKLVQFICLARAFGALNGATVHMVAGGRLLSGRNTDLVVAPRFSLVLCDFGAQQGHRHNGQDDEDDWEPNGKWEEEEHPTHAEQQHGDNECADDNLGHFFLYILYFV